VKRLRFVVTTAPRVAPKFKRDPDALVSFAPMDALLEGLGGLQSLETKSFSEVASGSYNYFEDGDVLLAKVTPCFENGKKAIARDLENGAGFATSEVLVFRPHDFGIDARYLRYLFSSEDFRHAAISSMTGAGGLRRVSERAVLDFPLRITELSSQLKIADFLDRETTRIDLLIEKKRRLVALLGEREEGTFVEHVTGKNLPHEKKHSGVEWIGEIPSHWFAPKFTHVARQETGHTPSRKVDDFWLPEDCIVPWVSLSDVWQLRDGGKIFVSETSEKISEIGMENSAARLLPKDTVILSRTASVGFPAILTIPMATTQDFAAWICSNRIRPLFLYYVLRAMKPEFRRLMMGSTHQTIYMPDIRSFRTPLPPLEEQDRITARLSATIRIFRQSSIALTMSIDRLMEYRSALITAAVTGQIDVETHTKSGTTDRRLEAIQEDMEA